MLVEAYNRAVVAFNERDLEAWIALMDEEVRIESRFSRFGDNYHHGHGAVRRWWADLEEAWEYIRVEPSEVRQVGPNETLALLHLAGKGRESGVAIREPVAHRVKWRDGRWLSLSYEDRAAAERELSTFA